MTRQTAVLLPDEVFDRLAAWAPPPAPTTESYIQEAVEEHIEELEDAQLAELALKRRENGESRTYSLEELGRELGLDD